MRWLLAIGCIALLIFFFNPPWAAFRASARAPAERALNDASAA